MDAATAGAWLLRLVGGALFVATLLPQLPSGSWPVRVCEFLRPGLLVAAVLVAAASLLLLGLGGPTDLWVLLMAMLASAGVQVWTLASYTPLLTTRPPIEQATDGPLRFMVANVDYENDETAAVAACLAERAPDVLLLVEVTEEWRAGLDGLAEQYPHRIEELRGDGLGIALWSKWPLERAEKARPVSERRAAIIAKVSPPDDAPFWVAGFHPTPPGLDDDTPGGRRSSRERDAELITIARWIAGSGEARWIAAGDLNVVPWSPHLRLFLKESGLLDPRVGRGLINTFNAKNPLVRFPIDHVLLSPSFTLSSLQRVRLPGSDHFALEAVLAQKAAKALAPEPDTEGDRLVEEGLRDSAKRGVLSEDASKPPPCVGAEAARGA